MGGKGLEILLILAILPHLSIFYIFRIELCSKILQLNVNTLVDYLLDQAVYLHLLTFDIFGIYFCLLILVMSPH